MSPATHAAVGAALTDRLPNLPLALAAAFASHFLLDAIWHFEAFYRLAVALEVTRETAVAIMGLAIGLGVGPGMLWLSRGDRELRLFCGYAAALNLTAAANSWQSQLTLTLGFSAAFLIWTRSRRGWIWIAGALAANILDQWKLANPAVRAVHDWWHYDWRTDLGFWLHRLLGQAPPSYWNRFEDPLSVFGSLLEIAIEATLLLGSLWLLSQPRRQARRREERRPPVGALAERG